MTTHQNNIPINYNTEIMQNDDELPKPQLTTTKHVKFKLKLSRMALYFYICQFLYTKH